MSTSSNSLEVITNLLNQYEELKALCDTKREERGNIDRELSNWYHIVEGISITHVSQSHKLILKGKEILERRRDIKFELNVLQATLDKITLSNSHVTTHIKNIIEKDKDVRQEIKDRAIL